MTEYAHPEVLVTTEWLAGHLTDPQVRVLEVDYDASACVRARPHPRRGPGRLEA